MKAYLIRMAVPSVTTNTDGLLTGIIVSQDKKMIKLAMGFMNGNPVNIFNIPVRCIIEKKELSERIKNEKKD